MKISFMILFISIVSTLIIEASPILASEEWNYENYLYSLEIISFDEDVAAGRKGSIIMEVGANTAVMVCLEFKGEFDWGHWVFDSKKIPLEAGTSTINEDIVVPVKTLIEPSSRFYYYVYVTLPDEDWNPSAWGLTQTINVILPSEMSSDTYLALLSHLKWIVDASELPEGVKRRLMSKLESAGSLICLAYKSGNLNKLNGAIGSMTAFMNKLDSEVVESYPEVELWRSQAEKIVDFLKSNN